MTHASNVIEPASLIQPYGGQLKHLIADPSETDELRRYAETLPSVRLSRRTTCDLELLSTGAFSPLDRFMGEADYRSVLADMRLADGRVFPVPVTLPADSSEVKPGADVALVDQTNNPLAIMRVEEIFEWDRDEFAGALLGTTSVRHPLVTEMAEWKDRFISGPLKVFALPRHYDFPELRLTPTEVRRRLTAMGNPNVVAFQTRNPLHRAHEELTKRAMDSSGASLLMHPVVGMTRSGDVESYSRVRTYEVLTERYYDKSRVLLSLLPLAMRFAGPREALWHAVIRRNYGANNFIVGRDHASPGLDESGKPFYRPEAASELVEQFSDEIGVKVIPFREFVFLPDDGRYEERSSVPSGTRYYALSGSQVREEYLNKGRHLPEWFTRKEVAEILETTLPPRHRQGVCIWFTGLSAAGKSTTAEILAAMLPRFGRRVTLLDGDVVRTNLSAGLGFDRHGRDANIRRIGFVASEIVRHGGVAICAAISPYRETRNEVRKLMDGNFIEVYVDTPLEVCEARDPKGLYLKARRGELRNLTGVDDVYEPPVASEIILETVDQTAEENAARIIEYLRHAGFIAAV